MNTRTVTITDPREFDGDPYQVASRAVAQIKGLTLLLIENLDAVDKMARNAELERLLSAGIDADDLREIAAAWPESPQGRKLSKVEELLGQIVLELSGLEKAVAYNPKSREARR
jgi:hypothetical protein